MTQVYKRKEVIGDCTLYLGDCVTLLQEIDPIDSVVRDPPYGIAYKSGYATKALWGDRNTIAQDETTAPPAI